MIFAALKDIVVHGTAQWKQGCDYEQTNRVSSYIIMGIGFSPIEKKGLYLICGITHFFIISVVKEAQESFVVLMAV